MEKIKVEIGQYRELNKGLMKAAFSVVIHPYGIKILDCKLFEKGNNIWFSFPVKEIKKPDQQKSDYIPLISFVNREYFEQLKIDILQAVLDRIAQENKDGQAKNPADNATSGVVQSKSSPIRFE